MNITIALHNEHRELQTLMTTSCPFDTINASSNRNFHAADALMLKSQSVFEKGETPKRTRVRSFPNTNLIQSTLRQTAISIRLTRLNRFLKHKDSTLVPKQTYVPKQEDKAAWSSCLGTYV